MAATWVHPETPERESVLRQAVTLFGELHREIRALDRRQQQQQQQNYARGGIVAASGVAAAATGGASVSLFGSGGLGLGVGGVGGSGTSALVQVCSRVLRCHFYVWTLIDARIVHREFLMPATDGAAQ